MIITRAMPTQQTAITGVSRRITAGQEIKAELCRGPGFHIDRAGFEAGTAPGNALMIGSTDELITKLVLAHEILGFDRVFGQIDWGGMPRGLVQDSIARYASEIAPAVRAATNPVG